MDEFKDLLKQVQEMNEFKQWKEKNPHFYLAHGFIELNKDFEAVIPWQIGYYNPNSDKIITLKLADGKLDISGEDEIFKKPEAKVPKLDIDKAKLNFSQIIDIVKEFKEKEYKSEIVGKSIVILQKLEDSEEIWNFTMITANMNTLNVWVDASTGEVVKHKLVSLMSYKQE
jgi:hypothetical protein